MPKFKFPALKGNLFQNLAPILVILSIALAFLVGVLWQKVRNLEGGAGITNTGQPGTADVPQPPPNGKLSADQVAKIPEVTDEDHVKGSRDAKVFLIEYSDLECPFCARFHPTAQQAVDEYGGQVAWVYRHFPLDTIHSKARPAAEASECVAELGGEDAFWAFTDAIFADQTIALSDLASTASKAGAGGSGFQACFDGGKYKDWVEDDYQAGLTAGVTGTPGNFIVNDKGEAWIIPGAVPYDILKQAIDEALGS